MKTPFKYTAAFTFVFISMYTFACDTCKLRQPKVTQDFTHGTGPDSDWDWFIVGLVIAITVVAFAYSVKYLIWPGERNKNHVKYNFLK